MTELIHVLDGLGKLLRSYSGRGSLHLHGGSVEEAVAYAAAQLPDGTNVLLCDRTNADPAAALNEGFLGKTPVRFEGTTQGGLRLETDGKLSTKDLPGDVPVESWSAYAPQRLRIRAREGVTRSVRYGLTNVRPPGVPRVEFQLGSEDASVEAALLRVPNYKLVFDRVLILRGIDVTCELELALASALDLVAAQQVASDICYLLSIAQGCKVEWVYREEHDEEGMLLREHWMRKTKPFCALRAVQLHPLTGIREFLEATYATYVRRRDAWDLTHGPIDTYLEAKAEADFLETRGAKLAVALEALKHRYLSSGDASVSEFILKPERFGEILPALQAVVTEALVHAGVSRGTASRMIPKLKGLHRESFGKILDDLAKTLGVPLDWPTRQGFVDSRNALVHRGQFYCKALEENPTIKVSEPAASTREEYFFMVNVLDRLFLKLVGYAGKYVDWRRPGQPLVVPLE